MFYIDPVCKKRLRRREEYAILKYGGNVYHLCCKACKEEFQKNPVKYILEGSFEKGPESYTVNPVRTGASQSADGSIILPSAPSISTADRSRRRSNGVK